MKKIPKFIRELYAMVDNIDNNRYIGWTQDGEHFAIRDVDGFQAMVLDRLPKRKMYKSFHRQLNRAGFQKINGKSPEGKRFTHPMFKRGNEGQLIHFKKQNSK